MEPTTLKLRLILLSLLSVRLVGCGVVIPSPIIEQPLNAKYKPTDNMHTVEFKTPAAIIPAMTASIKAQPITEKPPNAEWLRKHLGVNKKPNPLKLDELEKEVGRFCRGIWEHPERGRLLVLAGPPGTGKTHCAKAVKRWIDRVGPSKMFVGRPGFIRSISADFWPWPELLDVLKNGAWDLVEDIKKSHVLIIDELGGEYDPSMIGVEKLCQILSRREQKWTLITTNYPPSVWGEKLDERVRSRLFRGNSLIVDLEGVPDYTTVEPP